MRWWVSELLGWGGPAILVSWIVWVIASIILHELAHGWAAIRRGDFTPLEEGHMTWNPLVHMGSMSLLMFAVVGIAWGQMPVRPQNLRGRHAEAFVAAAGPAMNLALALGALVLGSLWIDYAAEAVPEKAYSNLVSFFAIGVELNLVLMLFNLLPVPPLDGSTILASWSFRFRELRHNPTFAQIGMLAFIVIFFKLSPHIWALADGILTSGFRWLTALLPGGSP